MHSILQLMWLVGQFMTNGRAYKLPPPVEGDIVYTSDDDSDTYVSDEGSTYVTSDSPVSEGGILYRYFRAIGRQLVRAQQDADAIKYAILPDNEVFDMEDARAWYRRLGLYDSGSVPLADMKAAILQRMSWPVAPLNRQSAAFIEQELRAAGFMVRVYMNRFDDGMGGYRTKKPSQVIGASLTAGRAMSGFFCLGVHTYGQNGAEKISLCVNYLEEEKDKKFKILNNLKQTIYIAGDAPNEFAEVLLVRKTEFRQLLLQLKTLETAAILFVNYV